MELSYKDQLEVLSPIRLKEGGALRIDCPFCKGHNCFGISRNGGVISWGCFRASCGVHGKKDVGFTREGIKHRLGYDAQVRGSLASTVSPIPAPLTGIGKLSNIIEWLASVNSLEAYNLGMVDIKYSPTEDRVMFKVPDKDGYTGRALSQKNFPKWKKFGDTSSIFKCGEGETGVIVEDAPSACAVGIVDGLTGIALLGTTLTMQHKIDLRKYKRLIVCLDPDAAGKSLGLAKRLQGVTDTSVKLIKDDLKYFKPEQIKEMLLA